MSETPRLYANIGAEEGEPPQRASTGRAETAVEQAWRALFEPPLYAWLEPAGQLFAWLNTDAARAQAKDAGVALAGADPAIVRRVHDKAFAHEVACRESLLPPELARAIAVLDPESLRDADAGVAAIAAALAAWPEALRARFTLKPRFGSSGRGRVAGTAGVADTPEIRGALPRLAERGGALLEPWCERTEDLSASLRIGAAGEILLLGTTRQWLTPAGLYRGQRGTFDTKARVTADSPHDERLREAAVVVARAAFAAGYVGPAGLDAFAYRSADGSIALRPAVEWNARFTVGLVAIGLLRRHRAAIVKAFRLRAPERLAFHFGLEAPPAGWPTARETIRTFPIRPGGVDSGPALVLARDRETLEQELGEAPA